MGRTTRRMAFSGMVRLRGRFNYRYVACLQSRRLVDKEKNEETMTDLTTKTAQSLHDKWCEQMRKKGWHDLGEACGKSKRDSYGQEYKCGDVYRQGVRTGKKVFCKWQHAELIPWPDLPESRRQEYLATAKAVLPEILEEAARLVCFECNNGAVKVPYPTEDGELVGHDFNGKMFLCGAAGIWRDLHDRRLEELKK